MGGRATFHTEETEQAEAQRYDIQEKCRKLSVTVCWDRVKQALQQ